MSGCAGCGAWGEDFRHIACAPFADAVDQASRAIAMRINEGKAATAHSVLQDAIVEKGRLTATGFADQIHMMATIGLRQGGSAICDGCFQCIDTSGSKVETIRCKQLVHGLTFITLN